MKTNLRDAYRAYNRQRQAEERYRRELRRIGAQIDALAESLEADIAAQRIRHETELVAEYTESLADDVAFNRVLARDTGHTPYGWEVACGCDGRMRALLRNPGWRVLSEVIDIVRRRKGMTDYTPLRPAAPLSIHINVKGVTR